MASPTIAGTVADQPVTGTNNLNPFSNVTIGDADGDELDVIINLNALDIPGGVREGDFTAASLAASGFTFNSGIGNWSFHGTGAQATAAIRLLVWDPNDPIGGDGITHLELTVTDGANFSFNFGTTIQWTAGSTNDPPEITSDGGGKNATVQFLENGTFSATDVEATDPDGDTLTFSIVGGADDDWFHIDPSSGALQFNRAPDFEAPTDANKDNIYQVIVEVSDGEGGTDKQTIFVNVNDVLGATINGTANSDVVDAKHTVDGERRPTNEGDTIHGKGKKDHLSGLGGSDIIFGGEGNDTLKGGEGLDLLDGDDLDKPDYLDLDIADYSDKTESIFVRLKGDQTTKVLIGANADTEDLIKRVEGIFGGSADDTFTGDDKINLFEGGDGNDTFVVSGGIDFFDGGDGRRDLASYRLLNAALVVKLAGSKGTNVLIQSGDDFVRKDRILNIEDLVGGKKGDLFIGDNNDNILRGADGNDTLAGGGGFDELDGGTGIDTADYSDQNGTVTILLGADEGVAQIDGEAEDVLKSIENASGGSKNDLFAGNDQANGFRGLGGNDGFRSGDSQGAADRDIFDGGGGDKDLVSYADATKKVSVALNESAQATVFVGGVAKDKVLNVESVEGGKVGDELVGDRNANVLIGNGGDDRLDSRSGLDVLEGGAGRDEFVFVTDPDSASSWDLIQDFSHRDDSILLDRSVFTNRRGDGIDGSDGGLGTLVSFQFHKGSEAGAGAAGRDDYILYDQSTGRLLYDIDGNEEALPQLIAKVDPGTVLDASDIIVI